jgi:hypothetical protein
VANPIPPDRDREEAKDDQIADSRFCFDYCNQQHGSSAEKHVLASLGSDKTSRPISFHLGSLGIGDTRQNSPSAAHPWRDKREFSVAEK